MTTDIDQCQRQYTYVTADWLPARLVDSNYMVENDKYPLLWIITSNIGSEFCVITTRDFKQAIKAEEPYIKECRIEETWPKNKPLMVKNNSHNEWKPRYLSHFDGKYVYCYCTGATAWTSNKRDTTCWEYWREPTEEELKDAI